MNDAEGQSAVPVTGRHAVSSTMDLEEQIVVAKERALLALYQQIPRLKRQAALVGATWAMQAVLTDDSPTGWSAITTGWSAIAPEGE